MTTIRLLVKKSLLFLLILLPLKATADPVSEAEAREKAQAFLRERGKSLSETDSTRTASKRRRAGEASNPAYYVFNVGDADGFVIVSGDDRTADILGYSDNGSIDMDALPDGLQYLLDGYEEQIALIKNEEVKSEEAKLKASQRRVKNLTLNSSPGLSIAPLLSCQWNQGMPYSDLCPTISGSHAVTGCVATSMAQVMFYHQWPETACNPIPEYSTKTKDKEKQETNLTIAPLPATTFDWDNMINNYNPRNPETGNLYLSGTTEQQSAVAVLMQYCGASIQMCYGLSANGGSSAYNEDIPYALKTYFGYDGGARNVYRRNYSYTDWVGLIYGELAARRPVILGGQSCGGGHSFVCDGYNTNDHSGADGDYFHINWGWAGTSDGYFLLSLLNPIEQGLGGSSSLDGFSFGQDAIIGIQPPVEGNADYCLSLEGLCLGGSDGTLNSKTFARDGETGKFTGISLYFLVYSYHRGSNAFDVAVQLVDESGNVQCDFGEVDNHTLTWNETISATISDLTIPSIVADGTYYIKVMSRPTGTSTWQECFDGDAYRLTATISNNELTIDVPITKDVAPAAVAFNVSGNLSTGSEQTVTATVTGGSGDYRGDIVLHVNNTAIMGQVAQIPAGEPVTLTFSYIPSVCGDNTLTLWTRRNGGTRIGSPQTVSITLDIGNNASNTSTIANNNGRTTDVRLSGRALYKDGDWNTLCLPFNITGAELDNPTHPLYGATIMELDRDGIHDGHQTGFDATDVSLYLYFNTSSGLVAGRPYIVKWASGENITNPVFKGVTLVSDFNDFESTDGKVKFLGNYSPVTLEGGDKSKLYLGSACNLYYPATNRTIGACRAFFELNFSGETNVKGVVLNFVEDDADGIGSIQNSKFKIQNEEDAWYDLSGRKIVNGKSSNGKLSRGIYIHKGRKEILN